MRNKRKRLVALVLCILMTLSLIGVQPSTSYATSTGNVGKSVSFSGGGSSGSTNVKTYIGLHFILVPYKAKYYAWENSKDIKKMSKGSVTMKSNMKYSISNMHNKSDKDDFDPNFSRYSIYVGINSNTKVAAPNASVIGTTGGGSSSNLAVRSYGFDKLDDIIKQMSGNNTSVIKAWNKVAEEMKTSNNATAGRIVGTLSNVSDKLTPAFNKLEARIQSSAGQTNNQTWLKKAFNKYNAAMERKADIGKDATLNDMYPESNGYYLIVEPVCFVYRYGKYLAVSAQDIYAYMNRNNNSLRDGFMGTFTEQKNGITKGAYPSARIVNLSSMLRQKDFKYNKSATIKANVKNGFSKSYGHNSYTFYQRGGYACIVPRGGTPPNDALYSVNQLSVYSGSVGSTSGTFSSSASTVTLGTADLTSDDYPSNVSVLKQESSAVITGNYLVALTGSSSNLRKLSTARTSISGNLTSANNKVSVSWQRGNINKPSAALIVGQRWGINSNSSVYSATSNPVNGDYFINNGIAGVANVSVAGDGFGENDIYTPDEMDNSDTVDDTKENENDTDDEVDDDDGASDDDDSGETDDDESTEEIDEMTGLVRDNLANTTYRYPIRAGKYTVVGGNKDTEDETVSEIKSIMKSTHKKAIDGYTKYVADRNMEDDIFNNYIPFSSTVVVNMSTIKSYGYDLVYKINDNGKGSFQNATEASGRGTYSTFADSSTNTGNNTDNAGYFKAGDDAFLAIVFTNTDKQGSAAVDYVKSLLNTNDPVVFMTKLEEIGAKPYVKTTADVEDGDKVWVGAEQKADGTGLTGYTVVFLGIDGNIPLTGDEVLEAYQLNNIDSNITSNFAKQHDANNPSKWIFHSRKVSTYMYDGNTTTITCSVCNKSWSPCLISTTKSNSVTYYDKCNEETTDKYIVARDGGGTSNGRYLIWTKIDNISTIYNYHTKERAKILSQGMDLNTANKYQFTYAYNLVRSIFEEKVASSLTANNGDSTNVTQTLEMSYGNVPKATTKNAESKRNPESLVGSKLSEVISWKGAYTKTLSKNNGIHRLADYTEFEHSCTGTDANGNAITGSASGKKITSDDWGTGKIKPFKLGTLPMKEARIIVTEWAKKYETDTLDVGTNDKDNGLISNTSTMQGKDTDGDSILNGDTRYSYLERHDIAGDDITLRFYPEVKMMSYKLNTSPIVNSDSVSPQPIYTMGESKRSAKSTSLYLYRVSSAKTTEGYPLKLQGKVYSDDMTTNSAGSGNGNAPVIYAGGNVSLQIDGANLNLNMYGYALDLVNHKIDFANKFKVNDTTSLDYKTVVDDNSDIYAIWGNDIDAAGNRSSEKLFNDYKRWVKKMADANNYSADVKLDVANGQKKYNDFGVTVGKIPYDESTQTRQDGVYPIAVYNGQVVKTEYHIDPDNPNSQDLSEGYKNLILQIQKDYNCDADTAEKLLEDSGMFDAIYKAIESSTSSFNKSGKANSLGYVGKTRGTGTDITSELGNNDNWYDEVVKTFCIRRYVTDTLHIEGTVLSDKIDYDAAPSDNSAGSGLNDKQFNYSTANAKWYVSYYFNENINKPETGETRTLYPTGSVFYDPTKVNMNPGLFDSASDGGKTTLVGDLHVEGADFIIPSGATTDEAN